MDRMIVDNVTAYDCIIDRFLSRHDGMPDKIITANKGSAIYDMGQYVCSQFNDKGI